MDAALFDYSTIRSLCRRVARGDIWARKVTASCMSPEISHHSTPEHREVHSKADTVLRIPVPQLLAAEKH